MLRSNSKQTREMHVVKTEERKGKAKVGKDLQKRKVLSLEWKSEWVMEYPWVLADNDRIRFYSWMLCTTAINTTNTIRTQTSAAETLIQLYGY